MLTALLNLPHLHTINLSDNAFGLNTQAPLVEFLAQHIPLRHLILNNNGLGPEAGTLIADALTSLHAKKEAARKDGKTVPDLETLVCGRNRLENGSMEAWAKAFAAHRGVEVVRMTQNGIRQEGISQLLRHGLRHARRLRVLDLQDNTFTVQGSLALADVLPQWSEAQELAIGDCYLTARGTTALAETLAKGENTKLHTVRLQYNELDAKALKALAGCAKVALPALKRVELNGNIFSEDDPSVGALRELLTNRMREAGVDHDDEDAPLWGLDSLSDLESDEDEDEDEEDEDDEDEEEKEATEAEEDDKTGKKDERILKEAEEAEEQNVPLEVDKSVDELAEKLSKTGLDQ